MVSISIYRTAARLISANPFRSLLADLAWGSGGWVLLEAVVVSAIFAMVGTAVLAGLTTAYTSGAKVEVQARAENIVRNQMEYVFSQPYREPQQTPYPIIALPSDYSVSTTTEHVDGSSDPEEEKVSVAVSYDSRVVVELETVRLRTDGLRLKVSNSNDRSLATRLQGETIGGSVYVFLDDPNGLVQQVQFHLDGFGPLHTEDGVPWDFKGGGGFGPTANAWNTTSDPAATNGIHTITAQTLLTGGDTINVTADFSISN